MRAVQLGNLPQMAEIVVGQLMQHLREGNGPHLVVLACPLSRGRGDGVKVEYEGAPQCRELLEMLPRGFLEQLLLLRPHQRREHRRILEHHAARALVVQPLDHGHMPQHFGNAPPIGRGFPLQNLFREIP